MKTLFDDLDVDVLDIKSIHKKALKEYGIETLKDLAAKSMSELSAIDRISAQTAGKIKRELKLVFGIALQKDPPKIKREKPKKESANVADFSEVKTLARYLFSGINYEQNIAVEYSIARRLIETYGYKSISQIIPNPKANYPAFYLSSWGKEYIAIQLSQINKPEVKSITVVVSNKDEVVKDNVETDVREIEILSQVQQKPKSFKDFIKR